MKAVLVDKHRRNHICCTSVWHNAC